MNGGNGLIDSGGAPNTYETGWLMTDNANIAPTNGNLACNMNFSTWTNTASSQENLPITCENWFEARAFCIWDGGFLPSESEWEFAGVAGSQQRAYPWGSTAPGTLNQYAIYSCYYGGGAGPGTCSGTANIAPVGSAPQGAGLWGQLDMAGDAAEWTLDLTVSPPPTCTDCAFLTNGDVYRAVHGGAFNDDTTHIAPLISQAYDPSQRLGYVAPGFRCARIP
ncbi:MAG TPA: formylglycine-generating enzyme family protein [Polyangiaceae bacterium]|jgi:formylglycine-generating enzyme required for sulfatase activity|nr:formylglycine-generating enzyme family protein [Polyangiaceae bacterium]